MDDDRRTLFRLTDPMPSSDVRDWTFRVTSGELKGMKFRITALPDSGETWVLHKMTHDAFFHEWVPRPDLEAAILSR